MHGGILIREARERAGLTQKALADRAGTTQSAIARVEGGSEPSLARLHALLAACGVSMQVHLSRFDDPGGAKLTPGSWRPSEPLRTLGRHEVPCILVGWAAAASHGVAVEVGVPTVVPDLTEEALVRLAAALEDLHARRRVRGDPDGTLPLDRSPTTLRSHRHWSIETPEGPIDIDFEPPGTRGYVDLARRAIDVAGLKVASAADTARQLDAASEDLTVITRLRELAA